jgi:DNA integrity scanning protein DisA with diadenylate cyclase activity
MVGGNPINDIEMLSEALDSEIQKKIGENSRILAEPMVDRYLAEYKKTIVQSVMIGVATGIAVLALDKISTSLGFPEIFWILIFGLVFFAIMMVVMVPYSKSIRKALVEEADEQIKAGITKMWPEIRSSREYRDITREAIKEALDDTTKVMDENRTEASQLHRGAK